MISILPYMAFLPFIILAFFILIISGFIITGNIRKRRAVRQIYNMSPDEKINMVNNVTSPFGFLYQCYGDIFTTARDSWQRSYGYCDLYDKQACRFSMIFDNEPIYFDYNGRTWLIELWKGQYGINTGAEIGLYRANRIIHPENYKKTLFRSASNDEMLPISFQITENKNIVFSNYGKHWWLTGFRVGMFSRPANLKMETAITFPNFEMMNSFVNALLDLGYNSGDIRICSLTVTFIFDRPYSRSSRILKHTRIWPAQKINRIFVGLFNFITRPFTETLDRVLYLELRLPRFFRRLFRVRKYRRVRRIFNRMH